MVGPTAMQEKQAARKGGKYLTFRLAGEEYGLEILKVGEVIRMMAITSVPRTPPFIKGVINLRGKVIPVMDLRSKFGMPPADETGERCIIVTHVGRVEMGIIVDGVSEVLDIPVDAIEDTPSFGAGVNTDFILGIGKAGEKVVILLDVDKVLTNEEVATLPEAGAIAKNVNPGKGDIQ